MQDRRIDLQTHFMPGCYIRRFLDRTGQPYIKQEGALYHFQYGPMCSYKINSATYDIDLVLAQMEANAIDLDILSINLPGAEILDEQSGIDLAKEVNDEFAAIAKAHPGKFSALITLPYRSIAAALSEMERAHKQHGFTGVMLFSNVFNTPLDDKRFWPLYEQAQRFDLPLYLHPTRPVIAPFVHEYGLEGMLGYVYDTSLAALRMILGGVFDAYPDLKLIVPHAGGVLPWLCARIDHQSRLIPGAAQNISAPPSRYIRNLYVDTVCLSADMLDFVYGMVGEEHILFATDYPFVPMETTINAVNAMDISSVARKKIFHQNAERLFKL